MANLFAKNLLGPISVAAYSYMSLVPLIQPPVIKLLTTKKERRIHMVYHESNAPRWLKVIFPISVTMIAGFIAPISVPLIGSLMFGNLIRESGVLERLSQARAERARQHRHPPLGHHDRLQYGGFQLPHLEGPS